MPLTRYHLNAIIKNQIDQTISFIVTTQALKIAYTQLKEGFKKVPEPLLATFPYKVHFLA
jgi:hypothetical protein